MQILKFYSMVFIVLILAGNIYLAGYKEEFSYFIVEVFYIPLLIYLFLS